MFFFSHVCQTRIRFCSEMSSTQLYMFYIKHVKVCVLDYNSCQYRLLYLFVTHSVRAWSNVTVNMTEESYTLTSLKKWQNYEVKIASKAVDGQMSTESPTIKSYVKGSGENTSNL